MSYYEKINKTDITEYVKKMNEQCERCKIGQGDLTCQNWWITSHMSLIFNKLDNDAKWMFLQLVNVDGCTIYNKNFKLLKKKKLAENLS